MASKTRAVFSFVLHVHLRLESLFIYSVIQADGAAPISKDVPTLPEPKEARQAGGGLEPAAAVHVLTIRWPEVAL